MSTKPVTAETLADRIDYLLINSGAHLIPKLYYKDWPAGARAFEDVYAIVGVWTYESFEDLVESWMTAQDAMIQLVSSNVVGTDSKAWDGYLVLCTSASVPPQLTGELNAVRGDTRRVRKLVVTADDLEAENLDEGLLKSLRRALAPVVDITVESFQDSRDPLDTLPQRLSDESAQLIRDLRITVGAYTRGIPALESLMRDDYQIAGESFETK